MSIERKEIIQNILDKYKITQNDEYSSNTILLCGESEDRVKISKAVSYDLMIPFINISYPETQINVNAADIFKVFTMCNTMPCVLLLEGLKHHHYEAIISLVREMDRMSKDTILIIATDSDISTIDTTILSRISMTYNLT